jgi:NADH-quinone oxidoreductase subunit E
MRKELEEILKSYEGQKGALMPILQKVQEKQDYLSPDALDEIADFLGMSPNEIYGVATFYTQFRFNHPGEHIIKVCLGTSCYVNGGEKILETVREELGINPGETTKDSIFSLERVACFGCCALAPVMVVDERVYSKMTPSKVKKILRSYREKNELR